MQNVQLWRRKRIWPRSRLPRPTTGRARARFGCGQRAGRRGAASLHASNLTVPAPVGDVVTKACGQIADAIKQGGGDASAPTIACSTLVNGGGGAQLSLLLHSPSFACVAVASAAQGNPQLADACSQLTTVLQPYSSQLGDALSPALGKLS